MTEPQTPATAAEEPSFRGKGRYGLIALVLIVLDQWSKWWVVQNLPLHLESPIIPGLLNFTHVENTGVAFGMFAGSGEGTGTWILIGLGLLALTMVLVYLRQVPRDNRLLLVALGLIVGGAIGNLIDRIAAGAVTDFIDFYFGSYHFHTFNLADSGITIGIVLIAWEAIFAQRGSADRDLRPAEPPA
jgi:signal peptidase II